MSIFAKAAAVVRSCRTAEQYRVAYIYLDTAYQGGYIDHDHYRDLHNYLTDSRFDKLEAMAEEV